MSLRIPEGKVMVWFSLTAKPNMGAIFIERDTNSDSWEVCKDAIGGSFVGYPVPENKAFLGMTEAYATSFTGR